MTHAGGDFGAEWSPDRRYRYQLTRRWTFIMQEARGDLNVIGLNPSTATDTVNDPTIRRCIGFAKRWGFGGLVMTNLFGYRATSPADMKAQADPEGPDNLRWLVGSARGAAMVLAAWGTHGSYEGQGTRVEAALAEAGVELYCLGITAGGYPAHPLYIPADREPVAYRSKP